VILLKTSTNTLSSLNKSMRAMKAHWLLMRRWKTTATPTLTSSKAEIRCQKISRCNFNVFPLGHFF
jgi:hypothetical protein